MSQRSRKSNSKFKFKIKKKFVTQTHTQHTFVIVNRVRSTHLYSFASFNPIIPDSSQRAGSAPAFPPTCSFLLLLIHQ